MDMQQVISVTMLQVTTFLGVAELLLVIPAGFILKRLGYSPLWALLGFIPLLGLPALWLLAFIRWPQSAPGQP